MNAQLGLRPNWRQFTLLVVLNAFVGAMVGIERTVLPLLAEHDFGIASHAAALSFIMAFGVSKALANYSTGRLAGRYGRKALLITGWSLALPALRVIRVLEQLKSAQRLPQMIRVDNGPEFISHKLDEWCRRHKITLTYIQPGKPTQNAYIERFNGTMRRELLNAYVFRTLDEVREKTSEWMID